MKKQFTLFLILGALFFTSSVPAQTAGFDDFWAKFKAAVKAKDKAAVAALTKFPLSMPYGMGSIKNKVQLNGKFSTVFNGEADAVKCFAKEKPERESATRYVVACDLKADPGAGDKPVVYSFERTKAGWKFVGLDNINE